MSIESKQNADIKEKILHIDPLKDEILPTLEMFSLMSPEQIKHTREQREKDGKTDDANRFATSSILELQEDCLKNFSYAETVPICNAISRLTDKMIIPDIKAGIKDKLDDLLHETDDKTRQEMLTQLIQITELLKQLTMIIEDKKIEEKDIETIE